VCPGTRYPEPDLSNPPSNTWIRRPVASGSVMDALLSSLANSLCPVSGCARISDRRLRGGGSSGPASQLR